MASPIDNSVHRVCAESLPVQKWRSEDLYQWSGFWFRPAYLQATQDILKLFKPLPTDVILASYPKTGTTWLKSLLFSITNRSTSPTPNHPHLLVPTLELQLYGPQPEPFTNFPSLNNSTTRVFATHIPYQILADTAKDCRFVYVTRNPKDAVVSLWQFVKKLMDDQEEGEAKWSLEIAVDKFCHGAVPFGPYYDHVLGYREESLKNPNKVFFITYEELKEDPKTHVKRLAQFSGCPFDDGRDDEVEEVIRSCSIETLKDQDVNKSSTDLLKWIKMPLNSFFREGKVGDHKKHLSGEQMEKIDTITRDKFHGAGFMYGV